MQFSLSFLCIFSVFFMTFIAVLGGAGFHSPNLEQKYKNLLKDACKTGLYGEKQLSSALKCVENAICKLEDSELTNAGYGSSLTRIGTVEMDSIIQDGQSGCFGAVGCVSSVRNPIKIAHQLLNDQLDPPQHEKDIGLVQPSFLVGAGVSDWCQQNCIISKCKPDELIAPERRQEFLNYREVISSSLMSSQKTPPQDTVGAICICQNGKTGRLSISSGSSSGGSVMKIPGRVGPAGVIGASCWCEQSSDGEQLCGVIVSGEGEFILSKLIARSLACHVMMANSMHESLPVVNVASEAFKKLRIFESGYQLGLILVYYAHTAEADETVKTVDVVWAHSSPSLAIGFSQLGSSLPLVKISRLNSNSSQHLVIEGRTFLLST